VIATASGACRGGDLLPVETTATMVRQIRSTVEVVIREVAGMEAEAVAEAVENSPYEVELPCDVNPPPGWPPVVGRSAEPEDFAR
jgi:hypothetical protein